MSTTSVLLVAAIAWAMAFAPMIQAASPEIEDIAMVPRLTISSDIGVNYSIIYADALATNQWYTLTNIVVTNSPNVVVDLTARQDARPPVTETAISKCNSGKIILKTAVTDGDPT